MLLSSNFWVSWATVPIAKKSPADKDVAVSPSGALALAPAKPGDAPASNAPSVEKLAVAGKAVVDAFRSMYKKVIPWKDHSIEVRHFGRMKVTVLYDGKEIASEEKPKASKLSTMFSATNAYRFQVIEEGNPVVYEVAWGDLAGMAWSSGMSCAEMAKQFSTTISKSAKRISQYAEFYE